MKRIVFITSTGNSQADRIFIGAFGRTDENGQFEIAPELKAIHLFALLTPKALAAQGIDLSQSSVTLEVPDEMEAAVKATMVNGLRSHWLETYSESTANMGPGIAKAALEQERAMVDTSVLQMIAATNLPSHGVVLESKFTNLAGAGWAPLTMSAKQVVQENRGAVWAVSEQPNGLAPLMAESQNQNPNTSYASGVVASAITVYAADDAQKAAVTDMMIGLPAVLRSRVIDGSNAHLVNIEWHQWRDEDTSTQENVSAPAANSDVEVETAVAADTPAA